MDELDQTLAALADPTRRAVVDLLRRKPLCSSDIADALSMSRPACSRHLKVLRRAGVVTEQTQKDDARVRVYQLDPVPFSRLRGWIADVEGYWGEQLLAFKAHAERRRKR